MLSVLFGVDFWSVLLLALHKCHGKLHSPANKSEGTASGQN